MPAPRSWLGFVLVMVGLSPFLGVVGAPLVVIPSVRESVGVLLSMLGFGGMVGIGFSCSMMVLAGGVMNEAPRLR